MQIQDIWEGNTLTHKEETLNSKDNNNKKKPPRLKKVLILHHKNANSKQYFFFSQEVYIGISGKVPEKVLWHLDKSKRNLQGNNCIVQDFLNYIPGK